MSSDTAVDMKEVELNELDPEKQPMTGDGQPTGGEKNGSVKVKVPEDEVAFTGLSKEELMRVAGTPGWVRTRWLLLVLFWLGWIGMLAGAIAIIVQAPRCKPLPKMKWWNEGPLYQISDAKAFSDGLDGVESKLDSLNQLKVKGLVLGPFHTVQKDQPHTLDLKTIDPTEGTQENLMAVVQKAHKKGMSVVLDLTPNYEGSAPWFTSGDMENVMEKVKEAADYWLGLGIDGIKLQNLEVASGAGDWSQLLMAVHGNDTEESDKLLMAVLKGVSPGQASHLVNTSGADLVLSDLLQTQTSGVERIKALDVLHANQRSIAWGVGAATQDQLAIPQGLIRLYQLLLFTLPGTPVFTYGDEIGLQKQGPESPKMPWNLEKAPEEGTSNATAEAQREAYVSTKKWFKSLSDLRGKERSLLHGDYYSLYSGPSSLAFLRLWDQSGRYITAANWGDTDAPIKFTALPGVELPESATVVLSTDPTQKEGTPVQLDELTLPAQQAVLLKFPYVA
ncbi:solute carrier family 3 member 2a [Synchiropus splendidus]|uniref:solute carrier family 3 member 2a n=1 Tax=Synchiropus splendidus TaxID=270530 RepID=UPI00237D8B53|nr:solute carrier family 3 member 2a [Synchiropus splendidus]XP_053715782.1 solute carrier family 3 member 2a [Synchiropus splendidus]